MKLAQVILTGGMTLGLAVSLAASDGLLVERRYPTTERRARLSIVEAADRLTSLDGDSAARRPVVMVVNDERQARSLHARVWFSERPVGADVEPDLDLRISLEPEDGHVRIAVEALPLAPESRVTEQLTERLVATYLEVFEGRLGAKVLNDPHW